MNILLIGGPYDDTVVPAEKDEDGYADEVTTMKESEYDLLHSDTQPVTGPHEAQATGVYVPAGITDNGSLAFLFHEPHPGCPRYVIRGTDA